MLDERRRTNSNYADVGMKMRRMFQSRVINEEPWKNTKMMLPRTELSYMRRGEERPMMEIYISLMRALFPKAMVWRMRLVSRMTLTAYSMLTIFPVLNASWSLLRPVYYTGGEDRQA